MREMLAPTSAVMGKGLGKAVAMITDGRFSGGSHGFVVGHITPEAAAGGLIGLIKNGDPITIDAVKNELTLELPAKEIRQRRKTLPNRTSCRGKPAACSPNTPNWSPARPEGAVTDKNLSNLPPPPTPMPWPRFKAHYCPVSELGLALDISRIPFPDDFLAKMEGPAVQQAFRGHGRVWSKGAIANPDEQRMVGHYWLRAPASWPPPRTIAARRSSATLASRSRNSPPRSTAGRDRRPQGARFTGIAGDWHRRFGARAAIRQPRARPARERTRWGCSFFDNTDPGRHGPGSGRTDGPAAGDAAHRHLQIRRHDRNPQRPARGRRRLSGGRAAAVLAITSRSPEQAPEIGQDWR